MSYDELLNELIDVEVNMRSLAVRRNELRQKLLASLAKRRISFAGLERIKAAQHERWAKTKRAKKEKTVKPPAVKKERSIAEQRMINKRIRAMNAARLAKKAAHDKAA
jgi:hypothetical protein